MVDPLRCPACKEGCSGRRVGPPFKGWWASIDIFCLQGGLLGSTSSMPRSWLANFFLSSQGSIPLVALPAGQMRRLSLGGSLYSLSPLVGPRAG
ncbi:unnamed protein product [Prunus armeniaca]